VSTPVLPQSKNESAVALGKLRQARLSPEERSRAGRHAAQARWQRKRALAEMAAITTGFSQIRDAMRDLVESLETQL
jgi:hypothetical protein